MPDLLMTPVYEVLLFGGDDVPYGLFDLHIAYAEQLCRLADYAPTSVKYVRKLMKRLEDAGYVQHGLVPTTTHGSP
jgi:hypothetical protein